MNKKVIVISLLIIIIISVIITAIIIYNKKLDGRECLDCPYVYNLKPADLEILDKNLNSLGYRDGYKASVSIGTVHEALEVDGTAMLQYDCTINYCFASTYVNQCIWNYDAKGTVTYEFKNEFVINKSFTIQTNNPPSSIYMRQNKITCNFNIKETTGKFKIYGKVLDK